jgi:transmembrane sensor
MADGRPSGTLIGVDNSALSDGVREAATAWFVRVQSDAATVDDWSALTLWLESSQAHAVALAEVEALSHEIDEAAVEILAALGPRSAEILPFRQSGPRQSPRRQPARTGTRTWGRGAIAAAFVGLAAAVGFAGWKASEGSLQTYRTGPGEIRVIALADGSHIRLDAASTMSVRLGMFSRHVQLGDAEASFDVAKDAKRPFEIAVGDQRVRVIGTEFNIRNYDGLTEVTVRRGIVAVYGGDEGDQPLARLTKGTELSHVVGSTRFITRHVDPDSAFAWTQGRLICDDLPLSEIVPYLNRRYATPISLAPGLSGRRFSGVLELSDEKDVVRRLATYLSLTMHGSDREISLS